MSKSLQEQLLRSGAARPKQAKKARREKAASKKAARQGNSGGVTAEERALQEQVAAAEAEKRARDRTLSAEQNARRAEREREDEAAQIVARHRVEPVADAADSAPYHYRVGTRIRSVHLSGEQRREVAAGRLAIVSHRGAPALVPRAAAERLPDTIAERIWLMRAEDGEAERGVASGDDPYADFPVPDDWVW